MLFISSFFFTGSKMLWLSIEMLNNSNRAVSRYWIVFLIFKSTQILMRLVDYHPIVLKLSVECRQVCSVRNFVMMAEAYKAVCEAVSENCRVNEFHTAHFVVKSGVNLS